MIIIVRSSRTDLFESTGAAYTYAKVDFLMHVEICDLSPSGEWAYILMFYIYMLKIDLLHRYIASSVNHTQAAPCGGAFMLQQVCNACVALCVYMWWSIVIAHTQGIQRRFIITLSYESGSDVQWTKVTELVVGM